MPGIQNPVFARPMVTDPEDEIDSGDDDSDFIDEVTKDEVASGPNEAADSESLVRAKVPSDLLKKYEFYSYRSAIAILTESHPSEFAELCEALRRFEITSTMIRTAGGNESEIPKSIAEMLRPKGWNETVIRGDLRVVRTSRALVGHTRKGKPKYEKREEKILRERFLNGHKVDFVKGRVAFDLEWNSKDQTFDRDLVAFSAFAQTGVVDVGVLVTRAVSLDPLLKKLGPALKKDGSVSLKSSGAQRMTFEKYGASTTQMGKLWYRLNAGRNGACPVLAVGITPGCVSDAAKFT